MVKLRRCLTRRRLIIATVGLVVLVVGWWFSAYPRGMIAAWADGAHEHQEVKVSGKPAPWAWEYDRLLKERYGVEIRHVAGCVVTQDLAWYMDGYNSVARPRIAARHNKDIFAECAADAEVAWKQAHLRK